MGLASGSVRGSAAVRDDGIAPWARGRTCGVTRGFDGVRDDGIGAVGDAEAAGRALIEIARMAETESRGLDRAFRVLRDGALVGPAATRLWEDLARRHAQLRDAFERAFASVEAIAARGDRPAPWVARPYLRPAPEPPPRREVVGGDPDLIEILAAEVTRTGRSWEDAGQGLRGILARVGADPSPGVAVAVAGDWVGAERRDLLHRRADLLKQVELAALETAYGDFIPAPGPSPAADGSAQGAAGAAATGGVSAGGASATRRGGSLSAGAALRALMARLDPFDQVIRRLEATTTSPKYDVTRGLAARLNRMGLPALGNSLTSLEREGKSFLLGVAESTAGLAKQVWAATPAGTALNRGLESAQLVTDPAGHAAETRAQLDGIIWGVQHPLEFAKAAADWETLQNDPARWTGRMTPDAILSAAGGGGIASRGLKAVRDAGKGAARAGREAKAEGTRNDAVRAASGAAGRAAADMAGTAARAATDAAKAAARVFRGFESNEAANQWGLETWRHTVDEMRQSAPERYWAVHRYTKDQTAPNAYWRGDSKYDTPEIRELTRKIDEALRSQPVPEDIFAARVTDLMEFREFRENPNVDPTEFVKGLTGKVESQDAYLSTSLGPKPTFAPHKDVVISLRVPKGTLGLYVEDLSAFPGERELLLARGLRYKIDSVTFGEDGRYYIEAHVV